MRKLWKIVFGFLALAGVFLIVLVFLVRFFVTPERIKSVVLPLAEQSLHRQITLGDVKVGLFSGIELQNLAVSDPGEGEPFVAADRALLRFQLLPLLARRVVIDEVILERPRIRLIRHADGSFNVTDLLASKAGEAPGTPDPVEEDSSLSVLVSVAQIREGRLSFVDRQVNAATELNELELDASGITRDGAVPVKLTALLQGAQLRMEGVARPLQKSGVFSVDLQGLDAVAFEPYYRGKVPGKLSRLLLDLNGEVDVQGRNLSSHGNLKGRELNLLLLALPAAPLQNAQIEVDYDMSLDLDRDRMAIAALNATYNGLAVQLNGDISELTIAPKGDLKLTVPGLDLGLLKSALPVAVLGKAAEFDLAGTLRASASLSGPVARPLQMLRSGDVVLDKVQATVAGVRPTVDGRIALTDETARIEAMTARVGDVTATIAGRIDKPLDAPVAEILITLPRVDLATALAAAPKESTKGITKFAPSGRIEGHARLSGPLASPAGLLKGAEITLAGVQVTAGGQRPEFAGRLKLTGDQLASEGLTVRLSGNVAQLDVTARNLFDKPIVATADITAQRFQLEPLLQDGAGAATAAAGDQPSATATAVSTDVPLQASGTIRIGETLWKGLTVKDFLAEYTLRDNQLTISRMTGKIAGGSFSNTARVDLRRPELSYDATLALQGVQADTILTALAPQAAGSLFGTMTVQVTINGNGTRWETISRTLSGDGVLKLANGRLVSPALVQGFSAVLQNPGLKEIAFNDFHGKTRINSGRAEFDSSLLGRQLKLFPKGTLGLDGSLNLVMDTRLSPELTMRIDQRGKVSRYLIDADGWSQVPLLVTGTLKSPRFGLDPKGVQAQAGKVLQQELQRGIDKLLTKPQPTTAAPAEPVSPQPDAGVPAAPAPETAPTSQKAPPPASPAQKLLEESLKRVLKH